MLMMRLAEERALSLYRQGKVPGSFYDGCGQEAIGVGAAYGSLEDRLCILHRDLGAHFVPRGHPGAIPGELHGSRRRRHRCGQEAIGVGAAYALSPDDRLCILHRDLGAHFVRGVEPERYLANYMGRSGGVTGGRDGNMHFGEPDLGCVGMVSMLPDMALVAYGMALAFKLRDEQRVALTFFGEGSTANGQWHEAMNFAGVQRLPAVFVLENNGFAYSTPNELEFAVDPIERAAGYGFGGVTVDGNDVEAVFAAAAEAAERARGGGGPTLIECRTMRMHGHGAHDDMS